jgi:iron complex outermembrane receptor protein
MLKKMLKTMLMIFALAWTSVSAQFTLTGKVQDAESRTPLAGATIQIQNSNLAVVADESGAFVLRNIPDPTITVIVRFVGYEEWRQAVSLTGDQTLEVSMNASNLLKEEIIVQGTRASANAPFTFTRLDAPAIQKQNFGQDLPFLLNWTPSLVTTSDAGTGIGYTGLRIRGSDATRINVTINGIPYNDSESQGTFWVDIPDVASSTQSIQIQRGVGTSTNGGSAFGATVNLQTNSTQPEAYGDMIMAIGSFNSQRYTGRLGTGLINNHWSFDAKASKILSDGYIDRASSDLSSYYLSGGYTSKKTNIKLITFGGHEVTYQSWYGVDAYTMKNVSRTFNYAGAIYDDAYNVLRYYQNQEDNYRQNHYQLHWTQKLSEYWNSNLSLHYTQGRGYYEEYHQDQPLAELGMADIIIRDTTIQAMDVVIRKWLDNKFYGGTFAFHYNKDKHAITVGGAFNQYGHAKHFGTIEWAEFSQAIFPQQHYYEGRSQKNDFNVYGKWNYTFLENLNGFLDVQYRAVTYSTSGIRDDQSPYAVDENFNFFNPKAGLSYLLGSGLLYTSYAIANREPNRNDYLDNEVKPKPERLQNLELGWRGKVAKHMVDVNYYLMHYKDQLVLTGEIDNTGFPIRANVGKSFRTGIETSANFFFSTKLSWHVNATWAVNKNVDFVALDENNVPERKNTTIVLSPSWIAGSQLSYNAFKGFNIAWLAKFVGKQYLDNTETDLLTLDSYLINDLRLSYGVPMKGAKEITTSLLLNNLLDVAYASNGYNYEGTPYFFPQAGRNFMAMVSLRF